MTSDTALDSAASIFGGAEMPNFSQIAQSAAAKRRPASIDPDPTAHLAVASSAPSADSSALSWRFVRYPQQREDGSINWSEALLVCDSFLPKEDFALARPSWKGMVFRDGAKESAFSIDVLAELRAAGRSILLHEESPPARFEQNLDGRVALDVENFALSLFAKAPRPELQALADGARSLFYARKIAALGASASPFTGEMPSDGWIELGAGSSTIHALAEPPLIRWPGEERAVSPSDPASQARLRDLILKARGCPPFQPRTEPLFAGGYSASDFKARDSASTVSAARPRRSP